MNKKKLNNYPIRRKKNIYLFSSFSFFFSFSFVFFMFITYQFTHSMLDFDLGNLTSVQFSSVQFGLGNADMFLLLTKKSYKTLHTYTHVRIPYQWSHRSAREKKQEEEGKNSERKTKQIKPPFNFKQSHTQIYIYLRKKNPTRSRNNQCQIVVSSTKHGK